MMTARAMVLFGLCLASAAHGELRRYKFLIERIPDEGTVCAVQAQRIADHFKRLTGVPLASARCTAGTGDRHDIELVYTAEWRIHAVSTIEYAVGVPASYQGTFHTLEQCEAALPAQIALFKAETALEPLVAFCYRESTEARRSYVLRIDSFGKPAREIHIANHDLLGRPLGDLDELERELIAYARAKLPALSSVVARTYVTEYAVRTVSYGSRGVRVENTGEFRSGAACERSRAFAARGLAALVPTPPLFCVWERLLDRHSLRLYQVRSGSHVDVVPYPRAYGSVRECEADAARALAEVAEGTGARALAAVCDDKGTVDMKALIERRVR